MLLRLRDPYSRVRDADVDRALRKLSRAAGTPPYPFEYSNFGYGVLSRALAAAGGKPFSTLLRQEVIKPLDLEDVTPETDPDPDRRRLFGRDGSGAWRSSTGATPPCPEPAPCFPASRACAGTWSSTSVPRPPCCRRPSSLSTNPAR